MPHDRVALHRVGLGDEKQIPKVRGKGVGGPRVAEGLPLDVGDGWNVSRDGRADPAMGVHVPAPT